MTATHKPDPRPSEIPPDWPDMEKDHKAIDQAFAELGDKVPLRDLLRRAQEIKDTL